MHQIEWKVYNYDLRACGWSTFGQHGKDTLKWPLRLYVTVLYCKCPKGRETMPFCDPKQSWNILLAFIVTLSYIRLEENKTLTISIRKYFNLHEKWVFAQWPPPERQRAWPVMSSNKTRREQLIWLQKFLETTIQSCKVLKL